MSFAIHVKTFTNINSFYYISISYFVNNIIGQALVSTMLYII